MKQFFIIFSTAVLLSSCSSHSFDFNSLEGGWERNMEEGEMIETWKKKSDSQFSGTSVQLVDQDTVWQESFNMIKSGENWVFSVNVPDQHEKPTAFKMIENSKSTFKLYNPENEFPKYISYSLKGNNLLAFITNGEADTIWFDFTRLNQ